MARYKVLKSVAHGLAQSFCSTLNYQNSDYVLGHLLRLGRATGESTFKVDLMTGRCEPMALVTRDTSEAAERYAKWLPHMVGVHKSDMKWVSAAHLTVSFDLSVQRPAKIDARLVESPSVCDVTIVDDRGTPWQSSVSDWWFPETLPFGARLRAWLRRP